MTCDLSFYLQRALDPTVDNYHPTIAVSHEYYIAEKAHAGIAFSTRTDRQDLFGILEYKTEGISPTDNNFPEAQVAQSVVWWHSTFEAPTARPIWAIFIVRVHASSHWHCL